MDYSRSDTDTGISQEIDEYIKESIDYTLGLPVSTKTLELKLQASEEARRNLQNQFFFLHSQLKEKDQTIERARSEASLNAQALKRFVEENQRLAQECSNLLNECSRWEKEGSLYEHDRDALMEFANEADERAKQAELRLLEADDQFKKFAEELEFYKNECEMHMVNETRLHAELHSMKERIKVFENLRSQECGSNQLDCIENQPGSPPAPPSTPEALSPVGVTLEDDLLDSVMAWMVNKDRIVETAHAFLEANSGVESCQKLLKMWDRLRPSTQKVIALAADVKILQNDKEHLRINLTRAEDEVKVLFEDNNAMEEENKRLLRLYNRERHHHGSGGKSANSASAKGNKRKSSPKTCSPIEGMIDFDSTDSSRLPLSPLQRNSPDSRMHKK